MINAATLQSILDAHEPASWGESRALAWARQELAAGSDPAEVLATLEASREEIADWTTLEREYGIAEALKLWGHRITEGWDKRVERTSPAEWIATLEAAAEGTASGG